MMMIHCNYSAWSGSGVGGGVAVQVISIPEETVQFDCYKPSSEKGRQTEREREVEGHQCNRITAANE